MNSSTQEAIERFLERYRSSFLHEREKALDEQIARDEDLLALAVKARESMSSYVKTKGSRESMASFTAAKAEYYQNPKVRERFELLKEIKSVLKPLEKALENEPEDPFDSF